MSEALVTRQRQLWLVAGRLGAATLLLGGSLLFGPQQGEFTTDALMALIASTFAVSLATLVILPRVQNPTPLAIAQVTYDLFLVTGLVYLLGGAASGFTFLYGVVILASALIIGPRATQLVTAAALTLYVTTGLGLANGWLPPPPDAPELEVPVDALGLSILRSLVGLILVGLLAANLAERLRRAGGQLREAAHSAAEYAKLNQDIMRSLASGLITTDLEGVVLRINPAGAQVLGAEPENLSGRLVTELLPLETLEPTERGEGTATRVDGSTFPVGYSCSPLRDTDGERLGTLVLFQDLTELSMLREKAERAERLAALGRLAAGLAHEIRNPLGSISGSVELVREARELGDEDKRLLTLVLGEVDRLDDLVTTMLEVGIPREPDFAAVDLGVLAAGVAKVAKSAGGVVVHVSAPPDPVRVHGDAGQLRQVLWNLVKNAIQFSAPGDRVEVEVGWDETSRPCVWVRDEGPGIAEEDREHIFDMFFSKRRHGVGLGLALVRQIVEAHRGEISVESVLGEGSTFAVHLRPAEDATATSARE